MIATPCPSCSSPLGDPFYTAAGVPVENSVVLSSRDEALGFPTGDVELSLCENCGFVANTAIGSGVRVPGYAYEDQQGFSATFNEFAAKLARRLVESYDVREKTVVEIGCGKGDFLYQLCEAGNNHGVGIDPLARADRLPDFAAKRIELVPELYAESHRRYRPQLVVCRHTLEHIPDVSTFLRTVRLSLDALPDAVVSIEVPDTIRILSEGAFWDVYYEHCSYFTPGSLARAMRLAGFDVVELLREYGDQYAIVDARPGTGGGEPLPLEESPAEAALLAGRFATHARDAVARWRDTIRNAARPPAIWGSGSKCVSFVSTLGVANEIGPVTDINPHRHGKYVPGIPTPIVPPNELVGHDPDLVIAMNPVYLAEITEAVRSLGLTCDVVAV